MQERRYLVENDDLSGRVMDRVLEPMSWDYDADGVPTAWADRVTATTHRIEPSPDNTHREPMNSGRRFCFLIQGDPKAWVTRDPAVVEAEAVPDGLS